MQCKCCRNEVNYEQGVCPVCGFLLLGANNMPAEAVAQHKKQVLDKVTLAVKLYTYEIEDEEVKNIQENWKQVGTASVLDFEKIYWLDCGFEEIVSAESFTVTVRMSQNGTEKEQQFTFRPGKDFCRANVGLKLADGFRLQVAAGTPENSLCSDAVNMIQG